MRLTTFIYALCEPGTRTVRYIGKADDPVKRLWAHLNKAKKENNHRNNWIRSLFAVGEKPVLEILDEVDNAFWPQWEVAWIAYYREQGFDLVNGTAGGEGSNNPTPETRAKLCAAKQGKKHSFFGKRHSSEARAKMSAAKTGLRHPNFGKRPSEDTISKIKASNTGKQRSKEHCANLSAALKGRKLSYETRAKMTASQKIRWQKRKETVCS